jgi:tetratricopeptide (TPR) repeat protein
MYQEILSNLRSMNINKAIQSAFEYYQKGNLKEAECLCKKILKKQPDNPDILNMLGALFCRLANYDLAIKYIRKALQFRPDDIALAYCNLGLALIETGHFDESITYCQKAIELRPSFAEAYCNLGYALIKKGHFDESITYCQKAIELRPSFAEAYYNLGCAFEEKGHFDKAITCYQKTIELNPSFAEAHFDISLILLLLGNFKEGWKKYEWRWKRKAYIQYCRNFSKPLWNGSEIKGLTILLQCEQGLGDTVQFFRYAPLIAQKGAKVIVDCQRELVSLLKNTEGEQQVIVQGEELPEFDVYCPLLSLPLIFNTTLETIPAKIPYIIVDSLLAQKWEDKVQYDNSKLKIGLVWAGRPEHKKDLNRSCSLDNFSPLAELGDISCYSLQKGAASEQAKNPPKGMKFIDYTEEIIDFSDTAALMENLDLIVSVDTSVVHLAGALGKPTWTLLPFAPDWRWMLNREDSPWYPTMRLFRQPSFGDWESVIVKVKDELLKLLGTT